MSARKRKGISLGSKIMLIITAASLCGFAFVFLKLSSGHSADLSRLHQQVINLQQTEKAPQPAAESEEKENTNASAVLPSTAGHNEKTESAENGEKRATLVFGGVTAIEENVRKSGYSTDSKKYDFSDLLTLLVPDLKSDLTGLFLENLLIDDTKVSSTVLPSAGADLLKAAGVQTAFIGFSGAWNKGESGIRSTMENLKNRGILPLGLLETEGEHRYLIRDIHGIRISLMQYTENLTSRDRKNMEKAGVPWMIPDADAEQIGRDISAARNEGAQIVIVMINWGKTGARNPDKKQMALAQQIADLGADVLIGAGSRTPQRTEYLASSNGRKMLCVYSLGTVISDNRSAPNRLGGYLIKLDFFGQEDGTVTLDKAGYVPTYVWRYRQDGKYEYRVLPADRPAPDGMDSEQARQMQKTMNAVQEVLEGGPLIMR